MKIVCLCLDLKIFSLCLPIVSRRFSLPTFLLLELFISQPLQHEQSWFAVCSVYVAVNTSTTLADILDDSGVRDDGPCNKQRVQLNGRQVTEYATRIPMEACGKLELEEVYTEKFLLCHAFVGGNVQYTPPVHLRRVSVGGVMRNYSYSDCRRIRTTILNTD